MCPKVGRRSIEDVVCQLRQGVGRESAGGALCSKEVDGHNPTMEYAAQRLVRGQSEGVAVATALDVTDYDSSDRPIGRLWLVLYIQDHQNVLVDLLLPPIDIRIDQANRRHAPASRGNDNWFSLSLTTQVSTAARIR